MGRLILFEELLAGTDGSAGGPDVVEEEVGGLLVDYVFRIELVGGAGLLLAGGAVGADLDSVFSAGDEREDGVAGEFREALGDEKGVVETAGTDVTTDGGEGDDVSLMIESGEGVGDDFGEGTG